MQRMPVEELCLQVVWRMATTGATCSMPAMPRVAPPVQRAHPAWRLTVEELSVHTHAHARKQGALWMRRPRMRTPVQAVPAPSPHAHPGCSRAPVSVASHLVLRVACCIVRCVLRVALYVAGCMLHSCRFGCSGWEGRLRASSTARSTHPQRRPSPMRFGCLRRSARSTRSRQRLRISIPQLGATRVIVGVCVF